MEERDIEARCNKETELDKLYGQDSAEDDVKVPHKVEGSDKTEDSLLGRLRGPLEDLST
jgi:hypothetical protein